MAAARTPKAMPCEMIKSKKKTKKIGGDGILAIFGEKSPAAAFWKFFRRRKFVYPRRHCGHYMHTGQGAQVYWAPVHESSKAAAPAGFNQREAGSSAVGTWGQLKRI